MAAEDLTARARLRQAALRLFARDGFEATSVRSVAAAAGVSAALVRHHFGSKEGLRTAVDDFVLRSFGTALDELDAGGSLGDVVAALGAVTARLFGADPDLRGYVRRVLLEGSATSTAVFEQLLEGTRAQIRRLADKGSIRPDTDPEWAPYQVLFLILGPLLLEPVIQPGLVGDAFAPDVLTARSAANQRFLIHGLFG
ncbi:TetR/AcrR family transcriptional regulator [Streptomyces tuirus]|uniref:TetR/AcrR family transcriptional regulator n=1 Tax=Streptomyces tuirus TaxID=68278 RepID=A0A941FJA1_9ACTN|nr:TetR/AcrR family transcriptional regulator [Streptomyces tuirus]